MNLKSQRKSILVGAAHTPAKQGKCKVTNFPTVKQTGIQKEGGNGVAEDIEPSEKSWGRT